MPEEAQHITLDNTDDRWWEQADLTKLILASNAISDISADIKQLSCLTVLDVSIMTIFIYLFIYCHLYSAFSIVQCSNALYRLGDGEIQGHTGQPSVREIDAHTMYNSMSNRSWPKPQLS